MSECHDERHSNMSDNEREPNKLDNERQSNMSDNEPFADLSETCCKDLTEKRKMFQTATTA